MPSRRPLGWFVAWLVGALSLWVASALADPRPLAMTFVGCDDTMSVDTLRIAQIELASDGEASAAMEQARIEVLCEESGALVRALRSEATLDKRMSFDTLDAATRARLVALGVAELARELARLPFAVPLVIATPKPAPEAPNPPPARAAWATLLGPSFRASLGARMLALGGRVIAERRTSTWLSLTLAAEGSTAERSIRGGSLRWNGGTVGLGARASTTHGILRLYTEAGVGGSYDQLAGRASDAGVHGASFSVVNAQGRVGLGGELRFLRHAVAALTLHAEYMLRPLRAENTGERTTQIGPALIGANLTLGAQW